MLGMMWLSLNTKLSFEDRMREALVYYRKKYGAASLCFVNPSMLAEQTKIDDVEVRPFKAVLPNHFWIGNLLTN